LGPGRGGKSFESMVGENGDWRVGPKRSAFQSPFSRGLFLAFQR
jgi:hypothetical protein